MRRQDIGIIGIVLVLLMAKEGSMSTWAGEKKIFPGYTIQKQQVFGEPYGNEGAIIANEVRMLAEAYAQVMGSR